jgi:hypothetical protein
MSACTEKLSGMFFKGTVQRDFNSFFVYIDRDRPEYETLPVFKFYRASSPFDIEFSIYHAVQDKMFRKDLIF